MQTAYARLHAAPPPHALRFVAAYTDGGVSDAGLQHWADHAFEPNLASSYRAGAADDVSVVALLKAAPHAADAALAEHRAHMVARCSAAAAVLYPEDPALLATPRKGKRLAAALLRDWSTAKLERFFTVLHQDLELALAADAAAAGGAGAGGAGDAGGAGGAGGAALDADAAGEGVGQLGRLLLDGVEPGAVPAELQRLRATLERIERRATLEPYRCVCGARPGG